MEVPVIVIVTPDTTGAVAAVVRVNVEVAAGLAGLTGFGVNMEAITPVGRPEIDSVTGWEVPETSNEETVEGALVVPWTRDMVVGATLRL